MTDSQFLEALAPAQAAGCVVVSVVSHGHGEQVRALLHQLARCAADAVGCVVLTLNQPEPGLEQALAADACERPWPFRLVLQGNPRPQGFGANHNQAFRQHAQPHWQRAGVAPGEARFAVLNPDLVLQADPFAPLLARLAAEPTLGCVCPVQVDIQGRRQDFARVLPTPGSIMRRVGWALCRRLGLPHAAQAPGQAAADAPPDWVNAAFWLLRAEAWAAMGGFDERYFMYGEDVDACLRLQLAGWGLAVESGARVVHVAQRGSRRSLRHLAWHLASLWRLWRSPAYARYRAARRSDTRAGRLP